jgi:hypothetical protein
MAVCVAVLAQQCLVVETLNVHSVASSLPDLVQFLCSENSSSRASVRRTATRGRSELENGGRDLNRMNHPPGKRFDSIRFERRIVGFVPIKLKVSENLCAVINDPQSRYSSS